MIELAIIAMSGDIEFLSKTQEIFNQMKETLKLIYLNWEILANGLQKKTSCVNTKGKQAVCPQACQWLVGDTSQIDIFRSTG